jgi:Flp pilus assembly protein TadD
MMNRATVADAIRHYRGGDRAAARRVCEGILAARPADHDARLLLAMLLIDDDEAERGGTLAEEILHQAPEHAGAHHALGKAHARAGRAEAAAQHLERSIALNPRNPDAYLDLSGLHLRQQHPKEAEAVLRRALAIAPQHPALLANLGGLLTARGAAAEAMTLLRRLVGLAPQVPAAHYNLALALKAAGDVAGAVVHYRRALALKPDYVEAHHNLGNALLDLGRVTEATEAYETTTRIRRAPGATVPRGLRTNASKLRHDIEQLSYLIEGQQLDQSAAAAIPALEAALAWVNEHAPDVPRAELPDDIARPLAAFYNRLLYRPATEAVPSGALNPGLDRAAIETDYHRNRPGVTHIDGFLKAKVLAALRQFCLEATVWYEARYANGYLGAFLDDGFCCPLLLQIAEDLRQALPGIFGSHTLRKLWAFKYDSRLSGIPMHADFAAVNVNFWVTPDAANLDPEGGGLVVWDKEAPLDWDFATYNNDQAAIRRFLDETGARAINVPHRQNRVVIFNSDLFHATAPLTFRDGYENRRINITMLYGRRGS